MNQIFGYASGILMMASAIPYIRDIFLLKTKPERATWLIWSFLQIIAFFSQLAKGAEYSLFLTIGDTITVTTVFIISIKYGMGGLMKRDIWALIGAGVSLFLWYLTKEPAVALFIIIFIDLLGGMLTLIKSYENPESETMISWMMAGFAGLLGTLAVGENNLILLSYPLYICLLNFAVGFTVLLRKRKLVKI